MKKLFLIISIILCVSMLAVGVSAGGDSAGENPYDIFKKCMDTMAAANTMEIKITSREIYDKGSAPSYASETVMYDSFKYILPPGDDFISRAELLGWYPGGEYFTRDYYKDGYVYDAIKREKNSINSTGVRFRNSFIWKSSVRTYQTIRRICPAFPPKSSPTAVIACVTK